MADPKKTTTPPAASLHKTASAAFLHLASLCAKLKPEGRAKALASTCADLADLLGDLPLTVQELADAYAALGSGTSNEAGDVTARRSTCVQLAELLALSIGKVAGARPPSANAMKAWGMVGAEFDAGEPARSATVRTTARREMVELIGRAAVAVVGRGPASVATPDGQVERSLSQLRPDAEGLVTIAAVHVGAAVFTLATPLVVSQQAALHKVAQPWALMGLQLGDVKHAH